MRQPTPEEIAKFEQQVRIQTPPSIAPFLHIDTQKGEKVILAAGSILGLRLWHRLGDAEAPYAAWLLLVSGTEVEISDQETIRDLAKQFRAKLPEED